MPEKEDVSHVDLCRADKSPHRLNTGTNIPSTGFPVARPLSNSYQPVSVPRSVTSPARTKNPPFLSNDSIPPSFNPLTPPTSSFFLSVSPNHLQCPRERLVPPNYPGDGGPWNIPHSHSSDRHFNPTSTPQLLVESR